MNNGIKTYNIIRWGIIGCGSVTEIKSGPAFQQVPNSRLVAVMRRTADLAKDYALRHNVPKWYTNAEDLINDPDVDAVYIATPPSSHKEYTLLCARAKKPVYVEKPMALNFAQCNEMINACKQTGTPLFVAYYRRKLPKFIKIKELINTEKVIGTPRHVTSILYRSHDPKLYDKNNLPWIVKPEISGGGLFVDLACHTLDVLDFIFGPIVSVAGHSSSQLNVYPAEDSVSMSFMFGNGMHGVGLWNFCSIDNYDRVEIVGDKGKISFATFGNSPIIVTNASSTQEIMIVNPVTIEQPFIEAIVQELLMQQSSPPNAEAAARTSWVMDKVLRKTS